MGMPLGVRTIPGHGLLANRHGQANPTIHACTCSHSKNQHRRTTRAGVDMHMECEVPGCSCGGYKREEAA